MDTFPYSIGDEPDTLAGVVHVHPAEAAMNMANRAVKAERTPNWVRKCQLIDVIDGDTLRVLIDLGMDEFRRTVIRLSGVDCPEKNTPKGIEARDFTFRWLTERHLGELTIETVKDKAEKFGRYLGIVRIGNACLNDDLLRFGFALPYDGKGPRPKHD